MTSSDFFASKRVKQLVSYRIVYYTCAVITTGRFVLLNCGVLRLHRERSTCQDIKQYAILVGSQWCLSDQVLVVIH